MIYYRQYRPSSFLSDFIECYWICQTSNSSFNNYERLVPGGRVEMIFNFAEPLHWLVSSDSNHGTLIKETHILGQRDQVFFARQNGAAHVLGVRFKPGGIAAFSNIPVSSLLNRCVPAENIFGAVIKEWESRLQESANEKDNIQLLDQLFTKAIKNNPVDHTAINMAIERIRCSSDSASINSLCTDTGWYYKKLERVFMKYVGYTPKYYQRIIRFNKALRQVAVRKELLTAICYNCGYYDQSHFIKDFYLFTGTTPGQFFLNENKMAGFLIHNQSV